MNINVYPHLIRHTFSTHMLNSGMSLNVLQQILGHDDPSTTLIYAELDNVTVENIVKFRGPYGFSFLCKNLGGRSWMYVMRNTRE